MKNVSLQKFAANFTAPPNTNLRTAVLDALSSVENAKQLCMMAGQMLLDEKQKMEHGQFQDYIAKSIPEISYETAKIWMRAAGNILKALPTIEVESTTVSQILATPDADLPAEALRYKQAWLDFTADKSIRQCLDSVTVYGSPAHNVDRAVNGKTKGGVGKQPDRKAFEKFTATKLGHITTFLTIQKKMAGTGKKKIVGPRPLSPVQQTQISAAFIHFLETAPNWLLLALHDKISTESKLTEGQRYSR